ncbi:MAG: hypothetical protein JRI68_11025, partial [Deltaproteobacteria bacterium]|nr:hypothetical protein [Deltaproteobacteria bacterium]
MRNTHALVALVLVGWAGAGCTDDGEIGHLTICAEGIHLGMDDVDHQLSGTLVATESNSCANKSGSAFSLDDADGN